MEWDEKITCSRESKFELVPKTGSNSLRSAKRVAKSMCLFVWCFCSPTLRFCMYNFWNMQIPRIVLVIYFMVMMTLAENLRSVYCDFDGFVAGCVCGCYFLSWGS